jgi:hypothetical protein
MPETNRSEEIGGCNRTYCVTIAAEELDDYLAEHTEGGFVWFVDENGGRHSVSLDTFRHPTILEPEI